MLGAGKVRLTGRAPNGHRFIANPLLIWLVADSEATLDGARLGPIGPSPTPGQLADFSLPQRGLFAIGRAFFEATPGKRRHVSMWFALSDSPQSSRM